MTAKSVPMVEANGKVKYYSIDPQEFGSFVELPSQHEKYFIVGQDTKSVAISLLIFTRARPEGIVNANRLMREAAAGRVARRRPIIVHPRDDGRLQVIDGNSTAINALISGWKDIPADIQTAS